MQNLKEKILVTQIQVSVSIRIAFTMQDTPAGTLQRKKSLPDVKSLDVTTQAQGSKAMTREEISVLSSMRREAVRRQLEEDEAYKHNPFLYILNPHFRVCINSCF